MSITRTSALAASLLFGAAACSGGNAAAPEVETPETTTEVAPIDQESGDEGTDAPAELNFSAINILESDDVCSLLTDDEVAAVLGDEFTATAQSAEENLGNPTCTWSIDEVFDTGDPVFSGIVVVGLSPGDYENGRLYSEGSVDVPGVGDEAYATAGNVLYVLQGENAFWVTMNGSPELLESEEGRATGEGIAQTILARLG